MKTYLKEKFHILLAFLLCYLLVEILTFIWIDFQFLPNAFYIDLMIAFAFSSVIFLMKSIKWSMVYLSVLFALVIILFLINATMYKVYFDIFTLQQLQLIGEAANVFDIEHVSISSFFAALGVIALYLFMMRYLFKKYNIAKRKTEHFLRNATIAYLCSLLFVFVFFTVDAQTINEFLETSNVTSFKRVSLEKYGMMGYYIKELEDIVEQSVLINDEDDPSNSAGEYVIEYSKPTEYFGLLEGKNVINILLESIQPFAVNEVLTPNLYNMTQDGLYFEHSYSENKTDVSELISIIGNHPSIRFKPDKYDYDFSYSFPMLLKNEGYVTSYFHDNVPDFYSRGDLMPQLGFDYLHFHDELYPDLEMWNWSGNYTLDSITMETMLPKFTDTEEPFYTFWASLSTHGPYNQNPDNITKFTELGYFSQIDQANQDGLWTNVLEDFEEVDVLRIRYYQAAVMDLDKALGIMLQDLENKGILDDTIIVLFGDHNVYYHNIHTKMFEDTDNHYYNMEMYKNFFCIYNPLLTETYLEYSGDMDSTISKFVSPYDIVPTLLDLFGYQYDINLFLGDSVFRDKEMVFYSLKLTGFFNQNHYSNDGYSILYYKEEYTLDQLNYFNPECFHLIQKINVINQYYSDSKTRK